MCDHEHDEASALEADVSRRAFLQLLGIGVATTGASTLLALPHAEALAATPPSDPTAAWSWYKTDPHVHSCISGDGECDVGIIAAAATSLGYAAMFLTDHQAANSGVIGSAIANHVVLDESLGLKWVPFRRGITSGVTTKMVPTPVRSGTSSLRLATTSTSRGEAGVCHQRGPTLRGSGFTMTFAVNPARLDPGCGFAVTCSLGGDPRIEPPEGFTTTDNMAHRGRSVLFVWQSAPFFAASSDPQKRVIVNTLPTGPLGSWQSYTLDVSAALATLPAAERPLDYNGFNQVTITAFADHGTADVNFDDFHFDAATAPSQGEEFVYRNTRLSDFDTPTFRVFPSIEMGLNRHVQRFDYGITQPLQMVAYSQGIQGIAPTQRLGSPAQLNHPGLPGGTNTADTINNLAYGADWIECCPRPGSVRVMMDIWDAVLMQAHVLGSWTSDMHRTGVLTSANRGLATYVLAEAFGFDELIRSFWEGRCYLATNTFPGRVLFTTGQLQTPYPARYPVWVSTNSPTLDLRLKIDDGMTAGHTVTWVVDSVVTATDAGTGSTYDRTRRVSVSGARSYVRAAVQDPSGTYVAMTQPVLVLPTSSLPAGTTVSIERVLTADKHHYTRIDCLGITAISGDAGALLLSMTHPADALVDVAIATATAPTSVKVGSGVVPSRSTRSAVQAASSSCWNYDAASQLLTIRVAHGPNPSVQVTVSNGGADLTAPSTPQNLVATADATEPSVLLAWEASTDDVAVRGYRVWRGGVFVAEVTGLSYTDGALQPSTAYTWTVEAVDTSDNLSPRSNTAAATTAARPATSTFPCSGDSYVDTSTGKGYGTAVKLRVDASPAITSYLRFEVAGLVGTITKATLQVRMTSDCTHLRASATSPGWTERDLTATTAPPLGATLSTATGLKTGQWALLDVTAGLDGNGPVAFALTTDSTVAASLSAREGTDPPVLVVETA